MKHAGSAIPAEVRGRSPEIVLDIQIARMKFTNMNLICRQKFSSIKYMFLAHLLVFVSQVLKSH